MRAPIDNKFLPLVRAAYRGWRPVTDTWEDLFVRQFGSSMVEDAKRKGLIRTRGGRIKLTHRGYRWLYSIMWPTERSIRKSA